MLSSLWWFASRKELFFTKWGPEEKAVLSVTDKMLSDASWLLVQVDVKTVNIPVRGRHEHREKNERGGSGRCSRFGEGFFLFDMEYRQCLIAVGRCPVVVLPHQVAVLEDCIQVVILSPPSLTVCSTMELRLKWLF